jgi:hypothetical protein
LSKKRTLRRLVPDISAAKLFHDLTQEFPGVSLQRPRGALPRDEGLNLCARPRNEAFGTRQQFPDDQLGMGTSVSQRT